MSSEDEMLGEPSTLPTELSDDGQIFAAEYKDGQLQIVEVSPYDKVAESESGPEYPHGAILPDLSPRDEQTKYLQLHDYDGKGLMQLNLLNFALVKSADGSSTYQLVSTGDGGEQAIACLLSDGDDDDPLDSSESYVMLEETDGDESVDPCIYLQTSTSEDNTSQQTDELKQEISQAQESAPPPPPPAQQKTVKRKLTPVEILEKAKALQKAKATLTTGGVCKRRGRRRKGSLPPPLELLSSPGFKLYLYSCKHCSFKCNAIKEMSAHKKAEHCVRSLQCAKCPTKTATHSQLMKHMRESHTEESATFVITDDNLKTSDLSSSSVMSCDVLVCGACGFESGSRTDFLTHISLEHSDAAAVYSILKKGNQNKKAKSSGKI